MSYEWITPKTDWITTTRFEYTDYNRIRNNLLYINEKLNELYPDKAQTLDLGDAKTGYANEYAVSEFNAFEEALESFTRIGQDVNVGDRNYYRGNNSFIWADALNRLEQCCLRWKDASMVRVESVTISGADNPIDIWTKTSYTAETIQLSATVLPSNASNKNVTWSSSNTSVATVTQTGLVRRVGKGTAIITVKTEDGNKTDTRTINVSYGLTSVSINASSWSARETGLTKQLTLTFNPTYAEGYEVAWSSSNTSVATVDNNGLVTTVGSGSAVITATINEPHFNNVITKTCSVTINITISSITITPKTLGITSTGTYYLDVAIEPQGASTDFVLTTTGVSSGVTITKEGTRVKVVATNINTLQAPVVKVAIQGKSDTANVMVGKGSWFEYKDQTYYYDFIYLGSDLDGSGIATMLAHRVFSDARNEKGFYGKWGNTRDGALAHYQINEVDGDIYAYVQEHFSNELKNALQSVTKKVHATNTTSKSITAKWFLPSKDEIDASYSSQQQFLDLKTVTYDYFYNNSDWKNRWNDGIIDLQDYSYSTTVDVLFRSIVYASTGSGWQYNKTIAICATNMVHTSINIASMDNNFPMRPLFFLSKNLRVKRSSITGIDYVIDWTGASSIKLSDITVGSKVADITGSK